MSKQNDASFHTLNSYVFRYDQVGNVLYMLKQEPGTRSVELELLKDGRVLINIKNALQFLFIFVCP